MYRKYRKPGWSAYPWVRCRFRVPMSTTTTNGMERAVKTFGVDEDETLQLVAVGHNGKVRQIGTVHQPGEFALMPTGALVPQVNAKQSGGELDLGDLKVVGDTVTIGPKDEMTVMLEVDAIGKPVATYHYPGVYGLLHVPFEK